MKTITIIAGPNGSGKSTLASQLGLKEKFISADDCEKRLFKDISDKNEREQRAAIAVAKEINESIKANMAFAFETVFAVDNLPTFLKTAKSKGYTISLHYIATENHDINIERVAKRVRDGGHDVPQDKIIERYSKSIALLSNLIVFVDKAIVYDNSESRLRPFLVKENNEIKIIDIVPNWAKSLID